MTDGDRPRRRTRHRAQIDALLRGTTEFLSAQRIHAELRDRGVRIGLTTVYRAMQAMAEEGAVDATRTPGGELVYRHCSPRHHHHLMCRSCARVVEVEGPAIERWTTAVAEHHGFRDLNHNVEIFGTCPSCAASPPAN
ncbi:Fur family ferric uptake transcriptional regulator [Catenuloplanes nepalensis]|uniref:Fur family ferric uptake transcriptional regulator n=1 Tax=Catenuloplanes nepalensis TaxID=587533 RepID=A0ABT9MPQ7_9ACTN|nr:Fur family transcriptional regulator [Catenuloplanes nepalensis]MDP9793306.1 Fur family ferric uptake transcriptional regulator [Catenuloplanes nepalensis]